MKVLCFHPALAPYRLDFFNRLAERVDLKLVFLQDNLQSQKFDQTALRSQLKCKNLVLTRGFSFKGRLIRFGLARLIKEQKPDVVVGYEFSLITFWLAVLKPFGNWKLWTSTDDRVEQVQSCRGFRRVLRNFILNRAEGCIVADNSVGSALRAVNPRLKNVSFVSIPIIHDTDAIRENAAAILREAASWRAKNLSDCEKALLFVGRFAQVKNLSWLIERVKGDSWPGNVRLFLVGDGALEESLKEMCKGYDRRIKFLGRMEGAALYVTMASSDALVLCSHSETYGAVVAEALQWGTPVVVSDRVGAKVLVKESNGVVYPHDDAKAFLKGVARVMTLKRGGGSLLPVSLQDAVSNLVREMEMKS